MRFQIGDQYDSHSTQVFARTKDSLDMAGRSSILRLFLRWTDQARLTNTRSNARNAELDALCDPFRTSTWQNSDRMLLTRSVDPPRLASSPGSRGKKERGAQNFRTPPSSEAMALRCSTATLPPQLALSPRHPSNSSHHFSSLSWGQTLAAAHGHLLSSALSSSNFQGARLSLSLSQKKERDEQVVVIKKHLTTEQLKFRDELIAPTSNTESRHLIQSVIRCNAQSAVATNMAPGTPVRPTSILVVGATGTLGRQIVRRALDEGYDVRCLVRPRPAPADFLRDWGATVVNVGLDVPFLSCCNSANFGSSADLSKPETIPATLVGVHTVIDCATGRPEEPIRTVDWEGKVALIQCAKAMSIQKYVFYSIHDCDKHPEVPLMEIKHCTEKFLQDSGITHIIIRLCGFMQGLIGQYAVPILEEKSVWGTDAPTRIAYMDTQDIARLTFVALRNAKIDNKLLTFAGPRAWTTQEVITLCERLAGQDANVTTVPVSVLKLTRQLTRFFQWTNDVADRLAFSEVLTSNTVFSTPMGEAYELLGVDSKDIVTLEKYLQDYFSNILKKLKDLKAQSKQTDIYF
ncbi:hypothetical protein ACLOJK_002351 [Asimina triloba]